MYIRYFLHTNLTNGVVKVRKKHNTLAGGGPITALSVGIFDKTTLHSEFQQVLHDYSRFFHLTYVCCVTLYLLLIV